MQIINAAISIARAPPTDLHRPIDQNTVQDGFSRRFYQEEAMGVGYELAISSLLLADCSVVPLSVVDVSPVLPTPCTLYAPADQACISRVEAEKSLVVAGCTNTTSLWHTTSECTKRTSKALSHSPKPFKRQASCLFRSKARSSED